MKELFNRENISHYYLKFNYEILYEVINYQNHPYQLRKYEDGIYEVLWLWGDLLCFDKEFDNFDMAYEYFMEVSGLKLNHEKDTNFNELLTYCLKVENKKAVV